MQWGVIVNLVRAIKLCLWGGAMGTLCLAGLIMPAEAQSIPAADLPTIKSQQNQIQRRHDDDIREREAERRKAIDTPPNGMETPKVEVPEGLEDGQCVDIQTFDVQGAELMDAGLLTVMTGEYAGRCLTLEQINTLLADISNWYLDRGYVTTKAYLPPQDLTTGTLQIVVIEGRVEDIRFSPGQDERNRLRTAFPGREGDVLNIRDLEQGLDQLNRLPSNNAKLKLEPGEKTGETVVLIENQQSRRMRLTLTEDTTGSRSTGVRQRTAEVEVDDLLGLNDLWSISYETGSTKSDLSGTKSISGSLSIPYGYWTFEYSDSWYDYLSLIEATTSTYESSGSSRQQDVSAEYVAHRDQDSKTSVEGVLTLKQTRNFIEGSLLDTQSRKLSIAALSLHHTTTVLDGSLTAEVTYEAGLRAFGAKKDHEVGDGDTRAQFRKWSSDISYSRSFQVGEQSFSASTSLSGQWTPHTLYSTERITVGGLTSVRGFKEETLSADVGGYAHTDLGWVLPATEFAYIDKTFGRFVPYAGLDIGWTQADPYEDGEGGTLAGWALGLKTSGGSVTFDIAWAEAIQRHRSITPKGRELYSSVSIEF